MQGTRNAASASNEVLLATATSVEDSGLLDTLLPAFEASTGYRVKALAVGTGEALAMADRGDVDVVLTHAPELELQSIERGSTVRRRPILRNAFIVVGAAGDPAGVRGSPDLASGLARIAAASSLFVSRGDNSGTHLRERELWRRSGIEPGGGWYLETGLAMGATLLIASERQAYALTDSSTYAALEERLHLEPLLPATADSSSGAATDPATVNLYSVLEVDPQRFTHVNHEGAAALSDFLVGRAGRELIGTHGIDRFGKPLFLPVDDGPAERGSHS